MRQVLAIVGPTAAGKTALSLAVARATGGEIVNLDAFQVYRGMDIGTAKPSAAEISEVAHHLIDVVDISHAGSVVEFQSLAGAAIADINARGKLAICVGGSGMYVRAVLDELDVPATDPLVRAKYEHLLAEVGADALHARLAEVDPTAASLILPGNTRRVVRALEVIELTGAEFKAALPPPQSRYDDVRVGIRVPRAELSQRIRLRIEQMLDSGWQDEVRELAAAGLFETRTACKAIGYLQVSQLNRGEMTRPAAVKQIAAATLKFSKRQLQWFERDARVHWIDYDDPELVDKTLELI